VDARRPVFAGVAAAGLAGNDPRGVLCPAPEPGRSHLAGLQFERVFRRLLVWAIVALHITGLLPEVIAVLESVSFSTGKQKLTLWTCCRASVAVMVTVLLALWLSSAIEARLNARDRARR
jgi:small-conductance mechanosensitive channel